jgi:hypothetical protein
VSKHIIYQFLPHTKEFVSVRNPFLAYGWASSIQIFRVQLRSALPFCNLDLQRYQPHGFSIGAATTTAALGFSKLQIQSMAWWLSSAFSTHTHIPTLNR